MSLVFLFCGMNLLEKVAMGRTNGTKAFKNRQKEGSGLAFWLAMDNVIQAFCRD